MLFSHNEPRSLDTYSATQASAPRPIGGRDISCALVYQISPGQSGECGACNRGLSQLPSRLDYHIPCPDTNSGANHRSESDVPQQSPRLSPQAFWCRAHWRRLRQQLMARHHAQQANCVLRRFWRGLWGLGQSGPPKTRLAHSRICRLPLPIYPAQFVAVLDERRPDFLQQPQRYPSLKGSVHRAVIWEFFRQLVPLTARSHSEYDCIQNCSGVDAFSASPLRRVEFADNGFYLVPQFVWHTPYCRQCFEFFPFFRHLHSLSIRSYRWLSSKITVLR